MFMKYLVLFLSGLSLSAAANNLPKTAQFGSATPVVTVVMFSDFECPYCAHASLTLEQLVVSNNDKVNLVYRNFPLPFHKHSRSAALAGVCANAQGTFRGMHDLIFQNQNQIGVDGLFLKFATQLKMDPQVFSNCLLSADAAEILEWDLAEASVFHIRATPTVLFLSENHAIKIVGDDTLEAYQAVLDPMLKSP